MTKRKVHYRHPWGTGAICQVKVVNFMYGELTNQPSQVTCLRCKKAMEREADETK